MTGAVSFRAKPATILLARKRCVCSAFTAANPKNCHHIAGYYSCRTSYRYHQQNQKRHSRRFCGGTHQRLGDGQTPSFCAANLVAHCAALPLAPECHQSQLHRQAADFHDDYSDRAHDRRQHLWQERRSAVSGAAVCLLDCDGHCVGVSG